ncbi:acyl-CoA thioesterase [Mucilaginibacter ginkgonis]|uniref:Acyl-CoA thioesterase n=1 Tax=Mucilaginibacter ginkgonis TaxID=2682091 RepID=A0A6I4HYA1_9SPHI|nr:acyl-CoA thioesterase [Mucilaginibacter ginkgonis]QQL49652.1 acyl-CoA thioesterase [Mucilaginibacter ginkgonis]
MLPNYQIKLRWSDLDPNFHLRHSRYYDLASQCRLEVLANYGLTVKVMEDQHFAPVLLREECVFMREIKFTDTVYIKLTIVSVSEDGLKWTILHEFIDDKNKTKAKLTVDITWLNVQTRRLAKPVPQPALDMYHALMADQ